MYPQQSEGSVQESPRSTQQRTPKLTPRLHDRLAQQSASTPQVAASMPQLQSLPVYFQSAHEPVSGPDGPPTRHRDELPHQPHSARPVQSPQLADPAQGSDAVQDEASHDHGVHEPVSGPAELPLTHRPVSPHQPHGYSPVQLVQSEWLVQVVLLPEQSSESHFQSAQKPEVGPVDDPAKHVLDVPHQPQPSEAVHASQVAPAQVVVPPPQWDGYQSQSEQDPVSGPAELPVAHVLVPAHHPQG